MSGERASMIPVAPWRPPALLVSLVFSVLLLVGCGDPATQEFHEADLSPDTVEPDTTAEPDTTVEPDTAIEDTAEPEPDVPPDIPEAPTRPVSIETVATPDPVVAGQILSVSCERFDADGFVVPVDEGESAPRWSLVPETSFETDAAGARVAVRAGEARATCEQASLGLVDPTPAVVTILPGPAHTVVTTLDASSVVAGESVTASCAVYDAWGNAIDPVQLGDALTLEVEPGNDGVSVEGLTATLTASGVYQVGCHVDGVDALHGDTLEVLAALPATIALARVPDQPVYGLGQIVTFETLVQDIYGNTVPDATVDVVSSPQATPFGAARYRFEAEGTYEITATVTSPTLDALPLVATTTVLVNGTGPQIGCTFPADGQMVNQAPGSTLTFTGAVADTHGITSVTVGGVEVAVGADGTFAHALPVRYGINFVDLTATDGFGEQNSTTCAFLASGAWHSETGYLDDSVSLKLRSAAIDDGNRSDPLDSLADLLHTVLNSTGLRTTLHNALLAANPLKPMSCDQEVCVFGCLCVFQSKVTYLSSTIGGPNSASLSLVTGGLGASITVRNIGIRVDVDGTVDTTGWAYVDYVTVSLEFAVSLGSNGVPTVTVRQNTVSASVGSVDLDFPGFGGLIIDILQTLFQNQIRNLVRDTIRDYVRNNFDDILGGIVGGLDVSSLGTSFAVPRLDGNGQITLGVGVDFSSVAFATWRALFGLGLRFTTTAAHAIPSLGVALPPGGVLSDPSGTTPLSAAVHVGVLNHALHALWRGGLFRATLAGNDLGGTLPSGATAVIETLLPPVVAARSGNEVELMLGAMRLSLTWPGLFDEPLEVVLGATADSSISLLGGDLRFSGITLDELYVSTPGISLNDSTRDILEDFVRDLLQQIIDQSLNDALPALPIPSFELPTSLSTYGLPGGRSLGMLSPTLSSSTRHFLLNGSFGLLP